jgi:hypothetical protein
MFVKCNKITVPNSENEYLTILMPLNQIIKIGFRKMYRNHKTILEINVQTESVKENYVF